MGSGEELAAVLIVSDRKPDSSMMVGATSRLERLERMRAFHSKAGATLRHLLASFDDLEIEEMDAVGGWTVRGPRKIVETIDGRLANTGFSVVENDRFFAISTG